jgi:hypothetical protein
MALPRTDSGVHGVMHPEMRTMHNLGVDLNRGQERSFKRPLEDLEGHVDRRPSASGREAPVLAPQRLLE